MLKITKTKAFRISAVVVALVALYALGGFVVAPRMIRSALMEDIPKTLGVTPTVGEIHLNPFLFQLEIKDFSLAAPNGERLLGFGRLFVDFELSSIWHRAYSFADIDIDAPSVNATVAQDGSLNLLQLKPKTPPAKTPPEKTGPLPAIRIGSFNVSKGLVTYDDHSRPSEFTARLEPINFALVNFTTGAEGGRFTFTASSKLGERVEWHGHLSVQPIESDGEFQIDGLHAHTIWEYIEDRLNFAVNSGTIDLNATYKFSLRDAVDLQATVSRIAVNDLAVRPKEADIDWITVPSLLVSGTTVDLLKRQAHCDSLSLTGVKLVTWLEPDGSFNLLKLAQSPPARASTAAAAAPPSAAAAVPPPTPTAALPPTSTAAPAASATPPWKFDLRELTLREAEISAEDRGTSPAAKVLLAPLSVKVDGVSLDLAKPVTVALDTRINHTGSLKVSGDVTPQPLSANVSLKLDGVGLEAAQPYIAQRTSMTLISGRLSGDAKVRYGAKKPALEFAGNISVAGLHTVDNALHDDFINWDRLDVSGIAFQHDPDRLDIQQVMARKLYARVIIEPDTSLNVKRVLAGPGATVVAPAGSGGAPVATTAPLPAAPRVKPVPGKVAASKAAAGPPAAAAPPPMPMAIKKIVLHAGQTNFADLSVQPNFATGIQSIEGTVLGLSSNPNSRAKVDIHGAVDAFSPVDITGDVNVLSAALYTDLALNFRNMELSIFNPYSGKFAGYNITKGKLTTELHYKVVGRKLDAQHHITVDQLEFGDKTASKDAVSLPIKLAVALLKDRHGVINLDIPVTGTLDDPTFRLGPIIWKVFVNILEKAVTAPFALLGALFGGGPDLQFVDFRPGAADLDPAAADKVRTMVKALNERPQIKIEVPIAWVGDLDRPALVDARFLTQVREAQSAKAGRKKSPADAPDFEQLDTSAKVELLTQLYAKNVGGEPKYPQEVTNIKTKPELASAKADFLKQALREHISVTDDDLTALGQQRAMAVQQALLTDSQVDPARVFLVVSEKAKNQDGMVRLELSLR
ncbi:MAG TPA: DUF748 domain-containing protein [Steroidobacteraceae bacterium]|nr:DUF748 domain-containing protein [Steroidobacteraceae bacterium]